MFFARQLAKGVWRLALAACGMQLGDQVCNFPLLERFLRQALWSVRR